MNSKLERDKQKLIQEKCQHILTELLRDEDNKYCVDCDAKGPRWASWNLGIFLCIRCAGIHRNLGVHISRVKSVNLDSWTPEQVGSIMNMGNSKARAVYEANLPDNFSRPQSDSPLEAFIRAKYELKKYIAKEWSETPPKPAFDIDELVKKEKENKKNKIKPITTIGGLSSSSDIQANSIPRPNASGTNVSNNQRSSSTAVSQKSTVAQTSSTIKKTTNDSASVDLLGLDLDTSAPTVADEPFGFFASANPASSINPISDKKTLEEEEKDFFCQTLPKEEKKLTKEGILSLYSQANSVPTLNNSAGFNPLAGLTASSSNQVVNPNANTLANQFAGLNLFGSMPPTGNTFPVQAIASNTNPFLASSGNPSGANLNFGAFSSCLNAAPAQQMSMNIGMSWPNTSVVPSTNGVSNCNFAMTPQANPFVNKQQQQNNNSTSNSLDAFDFKPTNGSSSGAISSFANFSNFSNNSSTENSSSISRDSSSTGFW